MGNCLVTKFKSVVNNDELDYLGKVKLRIAYRSQFPSTTTQILATDASQISVLGGATISVTPYAGLNYVSFNRQGSENATLLFEKYDTTKFTTFHIDYEFDLKDLLKFPNLSLAVFRSAKVINARFSLLSALPLETFKLDSTGDFDGSFEDLAAIPTLKSIQLISTLNKNYGDIYPLRGLPNLEQLIITDVYATDNQDTVTYLRNKGVEVTFTPKS